MLSDPDECVNGHHDGRRNGRIRPDAGSNQAMAGRSGKGAPSVSARTHPNRWTRKPSAEDRRVPMHEVPIRGGVDEQPADGDPVRPGVTASDRRQHPRVVGLAVGRADGRAQVVQAVPDLDESEGTIGIVAQADVDRPASVGRAHRELEGPVATVLGGQAQDEFLGGEVARVPRT